MREHDPRRVQIDWRKKGGRKPHGVMLCARPSKYGNPYDWRELGRLESIERYARYLDAMNERERAEFLQPLRKANGLACYCKLSEPCHVDELIKRLK